MAARWWAEIFFGLCLSLSCFAAQQPQWIAAVVVPSADQPSVFVRSFELPQAPAKALVRLNAHDRYRLAVNGRAVSVGDTPWDAETYDVTALLRQGSNTLTVTADAETPNPKNCFIGLRHSLSGPASFARLSFKTRGARADEWLYVEVVDDRGRTSGFYCVERKRPDLMLGHSGKEAEHVIELGKEPTLDYRQQSGDGSGCDFTKIVSVGIRMDRKDAWVNPSGQVVFASVTLQGPKEADLSDVSGWRLEPGVGESRRSALERGADGCFVLRYDFAPASDPQVAVDFCAWGPTGALTRVSSGPGWCANGAPARVADMPQDPFAWTPLDIAGPDEKARLPLAAGVTLGVGKSNGIAGLGHTVRVQVWACEALPGASVHVRAENWAGDEVMSRDVPVTWQGAVGCAELTTPALARGLYRFDAALPGICDQGRHAALAVLAPGETRVSAVYNTLMPLAKTKGDPVRGIDTSWNGTPALLFGFRDLGVNFLQVHLQSTQLDNSEFADLLAFCKATGLRFAINNEHANWATNAPASPSCGDRFVAPNGCHRWDLEPAALDAAAATGLFEGVVYDEGEHMQLCRNRIAFPRTSTGKPYLVETTGMTLPEARVAFIGAARQVSGYHRQHETRMIVESVFPALWHPLAQAGVTLCPKLLKEDVYPVVLALSLGAAKQYGAELWYTPDLWSLGHFPGHSLKKYETALHLAHTAGVDNFYCEHFMGHCRVRGTTYELTEYGVALRTFIRDWLPAHPRDYDYRDYEPEVAIIRFPDSDWGQASCYYWKCLYGALNLAPTPETAEWMQVFSLLTGGKADPRAVNANSAVYPKYEQPLVYPAPPTAVYDHLAGSELLRGVNTIFLCGITVSEPTLAAVVDRVKHGAVCFTTARLCPEQVRKQATALPARIADGQGAWVVLAGFHPEDLGVYEPLLPAVGDTLRLKFKGKTVNAGE
jgi:hypothetical protein